MTKKGKVIISDLPVTHTELSVRRVLKAPTLTHSSLRKLWATSGLLDIDVYDTCFD